MSGRCYACSDSFKKFFSGEKGCKNCGFEFCKKCITKKIAIPKLKNEVDYVCDKCYMQLSSGTKIKKQRPPSPPKAFVKRMDALEKRESKSLRQPDQQGANKKKDDRKYAGMETADANIMRRLEALKDDPNKEPLPDTKEIESRLAGLRAGKPEPPTEQEMRNRLTILQGKQSQPDSGGKPYFPPDTRSEGEQIIDLMDELFEEHQIETRQSGKDVQQMQRPTMASHPASNENTLSKKDVVDLKEINSLIEKSAKELELDAENAILSLQQDKQLMDRLKELKKKKDSKESKDEPETNTSIHNVDDDDDEENEDIIAQKLIKQYLEEAKLEEQTAEISAKRQMPEAETDKPEGSIPEVYKPEVKEEEFPWCVFCNDDAKIRCFDCDGDLYCAACFGQGHKEKHMKDHEFERYRKEN